LGFRV
jgi:hypothetical protein